MGNLGQVNDTQCELLSTIQANADRMIAIINDFLDLARMKAGKIDVELRLLHLREVLSGVMVELQPLLKERRHEVTVNIPSEVPLIFADPLRLHQILYNTLENTTKYTPIGGQVRIKAQKAVMHELPEDVRGTILVDRQYVQIDISDTGVGISPDEIERVFEPFYRAENTLKVEAGGIGLGLSLTKPLIESLGGRIWLISHPNEGSTFSFVLPTA
jgi:signal transduction histidine kinase